MACFAFLASCAYHRDEPPKVVNSMQSTNLASTNLEAQLEKIGMENGVGVHVVKDVNIDHLHLIDLTTSGSQQGYKNMQQAEDAIHKFLGNDFTNYTIMESAY